MSILDGLPAESVEEEASRLLETEGGKEKYAQLVECVATLEANGLTSLAHDVRSQLRSLRKRKFAGDEKLALAFKK